jgi:hypothetical protein
MIYDYLFRFDWEPYEMSLEAMGYSFHLIPYILRLYTVHVVTCCLFERVRNAKDLVRFTFG